MNNNEIVEISAVGVVKLKVKDLYQKFSECTDQVKETDSMEKIIEVLFRNKATRTVFVVGKKGKLLGVIRLQEILDAIGKDISPPFLSFTKKQKKVTAVDLMILPTIVQLEDNLEVALTVATKFGLQDIPVCHKGKLVGELDCFELIYGLSKQTV